MATFELPGYDSYSGCDIVVTARLATLNNSTKQLEEKIYTLGSLQTLSVSTHQDKKPVRVIGSMNALDYTMGQRTIAGSLVFAVFDQHFATEMFKDLEKATGKTFFLPDELPAMDITITFANEYGRTSRMAIYGLRIINEGQVMSINDLYTENTYQFVATAMQPLAKGTKAGSSAETNNQVSVASANSLNENPIYFGIEDNWTNAIFDNNPDLKRVLLIAEVEHPLFNSQQGIVKLTLSPNQYTGTIYIADQVQNKIIEEIHMENKALYSVFLDTGMYSAWYEDKGVTLSNTVLFNINSIGELNSNYADSPIIENLGEDFIEITSNNPTHLFGVCVNALTGGIIELELVSRGCKFTGLDSNTTYAIYTKNESSNSRTVVAKTLSPEEEFVSGFKNYVRSNRTLLSNDMSDYEEILDGIQTNKNVINYLEKKNDIKAKELMYMAVKYKNEFTAIINEDKVDNMPVKNLNNIYGNSFSFKTGAVKANIFMLKNNKEYFEHTESYPIEMTYTGKSNKAYTVTAITDEFVKSPKYTFFSYSDNDKHKIESVYGQANVLSTIELTDYMVANKKYPELALKCLAAADNKNIDIKLLPAPSVALDENSNIEVDVNYKDLLGVKDNVYYVCISLLDEVLDTTSFRKIKLTDADTVLFANKLLTAINKNNVYCVWIEDENYNVISELAFISADEVIENLNNSLLEDKISSIIAKIDSAGLRNNYNADLLSSVMSNGPSHKTVHYDLIQVILDYKLGNQFNIVYEILKDKFNKFYVNQDKYRKVIYDYNKEQIEFDNFKNAQLVSIGFKEGKAYKIDLLDSSTITIDKDNDYNLYYVIDNNPVIKSGFILVNRNGNILTHSIRLEEI